MIFLSPIMGLFVYHVVLTLKAAPIANGELLKFTKTELGLGR
jgi:hypothetical protein